ncbi:MAG TPA: GntR family transcriptional regulator [Solirubrobacterales bacterium]|jgi:DNA-binding GntR family transcriptional regulator
MTGTAAPPFAPLRRSSTADEVAALLRGRIVSGDLPPGIQLREVSLAAAIGVSRPTLREALQSLRQEGLVRHEPHRGTFVATLGREEIVDIYQVRRVLEGSAAAACGRAGADARARVERAFERLTEAWGSDDAIVIDADLRFHQEIVALLGSPRLDALFDSVTAALRPCLALLSRERRSVVLHPGSLAEHAEIAAAIVARKGRLAEKLLTAHIDANQRLLLSLVDPEEDAG